jgi:hypothetical protein
MNKQEARRITDEIRQVLVKVWDPIGIKDDPRAQDEYDSYIGGVFHPLVKHSSDKEIEDHLWKIVEDRIRFIHNRTQLKTPSTRSGGFGSNSLGRSKAAAQVDLGGRGK